MEDIYSMRLADEYFDMIRSGEKTLELMVNDVKRRKYQIGNVLTFIQRTDPSNTFKVTITNMFYFETIKDAVESLGKAKFGFPKNVTEDKIEDIMLTFYSQEEIDKYGVVAIEVQVLS